MGTKEPGACFECLLYLVLSIVSSVGIQAVERWANRGHRRLA